MVYSVCHCQQSDQGLQCLPFAAVWSVSTLFSILRLISIYSICHTQQFGQGLHYLPFLPSSIIKVYTTCHSQQSDQGLHYLPFSAVWSSSRSTLSFLGIVWSRSALFANLSSLIKVKVYTVILRNSLIRVYTNCHSQPFDHDLHYFPFFLSSIIKVYTVIFRNSLIKVCTICKSQQSDQGQGLHCHSQEQSDQGLH